MLKFCESASCSLATHLFSITVKKEGNEYVATPKQMFPNSQPDQNLIKNVQLFAFPDSCAIESKSLITFIIGDTHCDFQIGYALYTNSLSARCVLSNYYYPDLFESLLNLPDDELIKSVESLSRSEVRKSYQINKKVFYLDSGRQKQQLLKLIFDTFDPFDISKIVIAMLQARHIFVVSSSAAMCCKFAAGLPILIEPFCWDMNTIPILPLKLKDVCQVPVPTLIGLTRPEVLLEGRVAPHIIVNVDLKLVIDNPSLDSHDFEIRKKVTAHMAKFRSTYESIISPWRNFPGFPHKQVQMHLQKFIASYLQIYTGPVSTSDALIAALAKLPEFLESSQVIQSLQSKNHVSKNVSDAFEKWFDDIFKQKSMRKTVKLKKKSSNQEMQNSNSSPNISASSSTKSDNKESENLLEFVDSGFNDRKRDVQNSFLISFDNEAKTTTSNESSEDLLDFDSDTKFSQNLQSQSNRNFSSMDDLNLQNQNQSKNTLDDLLDLFAVDQGSQIGQPAQNMRSSFANTKNMTPTSKRRNAPPTSQSVDFSDWMFSGTANTPPPSSDKKIHAVYSTGGLTSASMSFQPVFSDSGFQTNQQQQQQRQFGNQGGNDDLLKFDSYSPTQIRGNQQQRNQQNPNQNKPSDDLIGFF